MSCIEVGDIFFAYTDATNPPKVKIHLCIAKNLFFLINTEKRLQGDNLLISKNDCTILEHDSYLAYGQIFNRNPDNFHILKKEKISGKLTKTIIDNVKVSILLTKYQQDLIIESLLNYLSKDNF